MKIFVFTFRFFVKEEPELYVSKALEKNNVLIMIFFLKKLF